MSPPRNAAKKNTSYRIPGSSLTDPQLYDKVPSDELKAQHKEFNDVVKSLEFLGIENLRLKIDKNPSPSNEELQDAAEFFTERVKELKPMVEQFKGANERLKDKGDANK